MEWQSGQFALARQRREQDSIPAEIIHVKILTAHFRKKRPQRRIADTLQRHEMMPHPSLTIVHVARQIHGCKGTTQIQTDASLRKIHTLPNSSRGLWTVSARTVSVLERLQLNANHDWSA